MEKINDGPPNTFIVNDEPTTFEQVKEWLDGGLIQIIYLDSQTQMIIDDEGKLKGLPYNIEATWIARAFERIFPDDFIVGNAVILKGKARLD